MQVDHVEIVEVSPRDGLQNDPTILVSEDKIELIARAVAAGARRLEAVSFVNPKRVPQMADAEAVAAGLERGAATYQGLALNKRGYDRAVAAGMDQANGVVVATDTFSQRNQGMSTDDAVTNFRAMAEDGRLPLGVAIAAAFGCPFEGEVPLARLMRVVEAVAEANPIEIGLADTIGVASPRDVAERVGAVRRAFPGIPVRLHLHDTRGTGLANAWAGIEAGVTSLDASLGGVGGCPFAPRATGNIATEDLVYMLERAGVSTGIDLDAAIETAAWLEAKLNHPVPGRVMKAGRFPAAA